MIKITIEMWPNGYAPAKYPIGSGIITNITSLEKENKKNKGDYIIKIFDDSDELIASEEITNFSREKKVWYLLYKSLEKIFKTK